MCLDVFVDTNLHTITQKRRQWKIKKKLSIIFPDYVTLSIWIGI